MGMLDKGTEKEMIGSGRGGEWEEDGEVTELLAGVSGNDGQGSTTEGKIVRFFF